MNDDRTNVSHVTMYLVCMNDCTFTYVLCILNMSDFFRRVLFLVSPCLCMCVLYVLCCFIVRCVCVRKRHHQRGDWEG